MTHSVKRFVVATVLAAVSALGIGAVAAPAHAATVHYMSCTHGAYGGSTFQDYAPGGVATRPYVLRNNSGHYQIFRVYYYGQQQGPSLGLYPGVAISMSSSVWPYTNVYGWSVQISDGNSCVPRVV